MIEYGWLLSIFLHSSDKQFWICLIYTQDMSKQRFGVKGIEYLALQFNFKVT